jgi:hypothetical protein
MKKRPTCLADSTCSPGTTLVLAHNGSTKKEQRSVEQILNKHCNQTAYQTYVHVLLLYARFAHLPIMYEHIYVLVENP